MTCCITLDAGYKWQFREISYNDYILTCGELATAVVADPCDLADQHWVGVDIQGHHHDAGSP